MTVQGPRVLMISSDRLILAPGSAVSARMKEYGSLVDRLDIVLLADRKHGLKEKEAELSSNVRVYPTNSFNKFLRPFDAVRIGASIDADIITAQDPFECGWAGLNLKRKLGIPLEVQLHTNPFSENFAGALNLVRKIIARIIIPKADRIRVVSKSLGREVEEGFGVRGEKISVLPIYIDRKRISAQPQFDLHDRYGFDRVMLCVSRLSAEKNVDIAIESLEHLPNTGLVIVGSGPEEASLRKLAQKLGLESRVVFAGWQEDLSSYYKTADVFVQTSKYEGHGMSLVEAGLCALPAVTTRVGVASELEDGRDAMIVEPKAEAVAAAVEDIFTNDLRRRELGVNLSRVMEAETLTKEAYLIKLKEGWMKLLKKR